MIDSQVHIWARENLPDGNRMEFARRAARSRLPFRDPKDIFERVGVGVWDPEATVLLDYMNRNEISVSVNQVCDFGPCFGEEAIWDQDGIHEHAYQLTQKHPGRIAFTCGVDPRRHDALQCLERCVKEWGAVGWQCFPANGYAPDDPICYRLYDKCAALGVPAVIRTGSGDIGPYTAFSHPFYVENVARAFRDLEIVMEHAGGGLDMLWKEALMVASVNPNVYLQIGLWHAESAIFGSPREPSRLPEFLRVLHTMREKIGAHRVVWASDHMRGSNEEKNDKWAALFKDLPAAAAEHGFTFTKEETDLIIDGNSKRIFKL